MIEFEAMHGALHNLLGAKLRSFLAVLGILVGTASVVALVTGGQAATDTALEQFKGLGVNLLDVQIQYQPDEKTRLSAKPLTYTDLMQAVAGVPGIEMAAPYSNGFWDTSYNGVALDASVLGATENLQTILKLKMKEGHFVSFVDQYEKYCVIGAELANKIRAHHVGPLLGTQVKIGGDYFTIIGELAPWRESAFFYTNINQSIIVPLRGMGLISANFRISSMMMTIEPKYNVDKLRENLQRHLTSAMPGQKWLIRSPKEMIAKMESQHDIFTLLLGLIGGISLIVGGIGVMNVMLVSVTERQREIGLRKALGATKRDIGHLFLSESLILALFGGTIGVLLGVSLAEIIAYFAKWTLKIYLLPIVVGFLVSALTGVFFGSYPAWLAAKLNPIDALRHE